MYINETFKDAKTVIQNNEDGLLTGRYTEKIDCFDPLCTSLVFADISFLIKYSDNKYKLKLVFKDMFLLSSRGKQELRYTLHGNYEEKLKLAYQSLNNSLNKYMQSDTEF